jgi:hypothetical protein
VTVLIFAGFSNLRIKLPRSIAGARSVYSEGSNPERKRTGSERWTETIADPRLHNVLTAPEGKFWRNVGGTSIEFRLDDCGDVDTNEGAEKLEFGGYNLAGAI